MILEIFAICAHCYLRVALTNKLHISSKIRDEVLAELNLKITILSTIYIFYITHDYTVTIIGKK